jgi:hypothetical protein
VRTSQRRYLMMEITAKKLGRESTVPGDRYASIKELARNDQTTSQNTNPEESETRPRKPGGVRGKAQRDEYQLSLPTHRRSSPCKEQQAECQRGGDRILAVWWQGSCEPKRVFLLSTDVQRTPYAPDQSRRPYQFGSLIENGREQPCSFLQVVISDHTKMV